MSFFRDSTSLLIVALIAVIFAASKTASAASAPHSVAVFSYTAGLSSPDASITRAAVAVLSCKIDSTLELNTVLESEYSLVSGGISASKLWERNSPEAARVARSLRADMIVSVRLVSRAGGKIGAEARIAAVSKEKVAWRKIDLNIPSGDIAGFQKKIAVALLESLSPGSGKEAAASMPYTSSRAAFNSFGDGIGQIEAGRGDDALKSFSAAERADKNFRDLFYYLGKYFATQKFDYEKALSYMGRIIAQNPNDAGAQYWLGFTYYLKGDSARSIRAFETSVKLKPMQPDAYSYLAVLYKDRAQLEKVEAYYMKALEMAPRNAAAWYNLGAVQSVMGKTSESLSSLSKALDLDCDSFLPIVKNDADFINARKKPDFSKTIKDYARKCGK